MSFEIMLTQIVFMPFKFLVANYEDKEQEDQAIKQYDK